MNPTTPLTLTPAARAALLKASGMGRDRLARLLAVEAAIARHPERYSELWAPLAPAAADEREVA
jgi:hypothetical protein